MSNQPELHSVDWSKIPAPEDDGGARHLTGMTVPDIALPATSVRPYPWRGCPD